MAHEQQAELRTPQPAGGAQRGLADPRFAVPEQHRQALRVLRPPVADGHRGEMTICRVGRIGQRVDPGPIAPQRPHLRQPARGLRHGRLDVRIGLGLGPHFSQLRLEVDQPARSDALERGDPRRRTLAAERVGERRW